MTAFATRPTARCARRSTPRTTWVAAGGSCSRSRRTARSRSRRPWPSCRRSQRRSRSTAPPRPPRRERGHHASTAVAIGGNGLVLAAGVGRLDDPRAGAQRLPHGHHRRPAGTDVRRDRRPVERQHDRAELRRHDVRRPRGEPASNDQGIVVTGSGNTIGGVGAGNLVSGNKANGILIDGSAGAHDNVVSANLVGTNATGNALSAERRRHPDDQRRAAHGDRRQVGSRGQRRRRLGERHRHPGHRRRAGQLGDPLQQRRCRPGRHDGARTARARGRSASTTPTA